MRRISLLLAILLLSSVSRELFAQQPQAQAQGYFNAYLLKKDGSLFPYASTATTGLPTQADLYYGNGDSTVYTWVIARTSGQTGISHTDFLGLSCLNGKTNYTVQYKTSRSSAWSTQANSGLVFGADAAQNCTSSTDIMKVPQSAATDSLFIKVKLVGGYFAPKFSDYNIVVKVGGQNQACNTTQSYVPDCTPTVVCTLSASATAGTISCFGGSTTISSSVSNGTSPYTYSWSGTSGATGTASSTSARAGIYSLTVTDANSCTATASGTITQPTAIVATPSAGTISCYGGSTTVSLSASGGTAPYKSYAWSGTSGATGTASSTSASVGSYSVVVTDNNNCTATASGTITQPTAIVATPSAGTISCYGGSTTVSLSASGGTAPYKSYAWSGTSGATGTVSSTSASVGSYSVVVTDNNNCTATASGTITQPAAVTASVTVPSIACNAGTTTITINGLGGTGTLNYSINNGDYNQASNVFSSIAAGLYDVKVTDANNCFTSTSVTVSQPAAVTASVTVPSIACNAGTTTITINGLGGTGTLNYSINNGDYNQASNVFSSIAAGLYDVKVTDANNCSTSTSVTVSQPAAVTASVTVPSIACNAGTTTITINGLGGTGTLNYSINNGDYNQASNVFSSIAAGLYDVKVTDANNCSTSTSVTVSQPAAVIATVSATDVSCNAGSNGSVDLTAGGGTGALSYAWSNSSTSEDISGLSAGTYNVTVTDANSCTATASATVGEPTAVTATVSATDVSCNAGSNGSVDLTAGGGTGALSYAWSNSSTSEDISGLSAGTYNVTVTDANSCTATASATVGEPTAVTATASATDVSCNAGSNGSVDLTAGGGTGALSYAWSNSSTSEDISGLSAGTYNVTVTDANSCTATASATVGEPTAVTATASATDVSCNAGSNGSVDLTAGGGTGALSYAWSNSSTSEDISGLSAGTYNVTVTDANSCTATASATVGEPTAVTATASATDVSCNAGSNGSVDLTAGGGTGALSYAWSNSSTSEDISGLSAGTYNVTVTDANSCTATASATVGEPTAVTATASATDVSCNAGSNGSVDLTAGGGTGALSYAWSNSSTSEDISGLSAGTYNVTVTDANSCTATASATVGEPTAINIEVSKTDAICTATASFGTISISASGGNGDLKFEWISGNANGDETNNENSATFENLSAGTYDLKVTDESGCFVTSTETIQVTNKPTISLSSTDLTVCGTSATITATTDESNIVWKDALNNEIVTGKEFTTTSNGTYTVFVTNEDGCESTASATVTINQNPTVNVSAPAVCEGTIATVSANVTAGSATGTYTYTWTGATPGNVSSFNPTSAGSYSVVVTDANGCNGSNSATLSFNANPSVTVANATVCSGSSTTLTANVTSGKPAYTYSWTGDISGSKTSSSVTTNSLTSVSTYYVTVTDANSCSGSASATVSVNEVPVLSINNIEDCGPTVDLTKLPAGTIKSSLKTVSGIDVTPIVKFYTDANCTQEIKDLTKVPGGRYYAKATAPTIAGVVDPNTNSCATIVPFTVKITCYSFTVSQGFYGSTSGTKCVNGNIGLTAVKLIDYIVNSRIVKIGGINSFTFSKGSELNKIMPGGGTATTLPSGQYYAANPGTLIITKQGKISNVLLSQTITMWLNINMPNNNIGYWKLADVGGAAATIDAKLGGNKTIAQLVDAAQAALGTALAKNSSYTYADLVNALDACVQKWDNSTAGNQACASTPTGIRSSNNNLIASEDGVTAAATPITSPAVSSTSIKTKVYPNPYTDRVNIQVNAKNQGKASLILYNMSGQRVATIFEGEMKAGIQTFNYNVPVTQRRGLIYIFRQNGEAETGILIGANR